MRHVPNKHLLGNPHSPISLLEHNCYGTRNEASKRGVPPPRLLAYPYLMSLSTNRQSRTAWRTASLRHSQLNLLKRDILVEG